MIAAQVLPVDVIEGAVIGLRHHRCMPECRPLAVYHPGDESVPGGTDAVGVGDADRAVNQPPLLNPGCPCHLPRGIQGEPATVHAFGTVFAPRVNNGDASAHGTLAANQLPRSRHHRGVAHLHATDIGDAIERARLAFEGDPQIPCPLGTGRDAGYRRQQ